MNIKELEKKWIGKKTRESVAFNYQCVAWAKKGIFELYGIKLKTFSGSALRGWKTGSPFDDKWERVENTVNAVPDSGAVVFFNKMYVGKKCVNPYGHVAIVGEGSTQLKLVVIEQNAGSGNGDGLGGNAITKRILDYIKPAKCLGWFQIKK